MQVSYHESRYNQAADNDVSFCRVSGYENGLLGYKPRIHNLIKREKNVDTAMFGETID